MALAALAFAASGAGGSDDTGTVARGQGAAGSAGKGNVIVVTMGGSGGSVHPGPSGGTANNLGSCEDFSFDGCVGEGFEGESVPLLS